MAKASETKSPSQATVKRLFAVSGNRCAFPNCPTPLIDLTSGTVVGEICHIKASKPGAPRYDPLQTAKERHGFDNLLLLCNVHHKIVDDDALAYTVERLILMKNEHEARHLAPPTVDTAAAQRFVKVAIENSRIQGSVVTSHGQIGGQTAHSIHNYYGLQKADEPVRLEGKLDVAGDLELIAATGCPGLRLTVICRSSRPAKIQSASLFVSNVDVMSGFQSGFNHDFGYTPMEGTSQTLTVKLVPLSKPNSPEGFVLNQDDVCRFFYPLPTPATTLGLRAKPEDLSIVIRFFDETEQTILTGRDVQNVLESVMVVYREMAGKFVGNLQMGVRVTSTTPPNVEMLGKVNPKAVPIAKPDPPEASK